MTVTVLELKSGKFIEFPFVKEILVGNKHHWLLFDSGDEFKVNTSEYQLMSVEAVRGC